MTKTNVTFLMIENSCIIPIIGINKLNFTVFTDNNIKHCYNYYYTLSLCSVIISYNIQNKKKTNRISDSTKNSRWL